MSINVSEPNRAGLPRAMNALIDEHQASSELRTDYKALAAGGPSTKVYWRALCDVILRTIFAVAILAVGCWIPEAHLSGIPFCYGATDPVLSLASLVSKVAACIFGIMACWSFRCVFETLWLDRVQQSRRLSCE